MVGISFAGLVFTVIASLPLIGGLWLAAIGFGWPLGRLITPATGQGRFDGLVVQTGLGMAALLQINWLMAWAGVLNATTAWVLIAIGVALLLGQITRWYLRNKPEYISFPPVPWPVLLAIPALSLLAVACMCPPGTLWSIEARAYDVMIYHLQLPNEWLAQGRATGLHHSVYSYLPNLVECGYMLIAAVKGSIYSAVYPTQFFHASAALYAAVAIGCVAARFAGALSGTIAAALFLCLPWTIITGSLAYNEMFVMAFGGCALLIVLTPTDHQLRAAAAIGLLAGSATLAKLTGGAMVAVPIGLIILLRLGVKRADPTRPSVRSAVLTAAVAAVVGGAVLLPWMSRNALDTGNPVFPFATKTLGTGHWPTEVAQRWDSSHQVEADTGARFRALGQQWLCNRGYGAVFGPKRQRQSNRLEAQNIARFDNEWGLPTLWIAMLLAAVITLRNRPTRHVATALLLMLAVQVVFWLFFTHLQSRFLIPTLLPACSLVGIGLGVASQSKHRHTTWAIPAVAVVGVAAFTWLSFGELRRQAVGLPHNGKLEQFATWQIMDSLPPLDRLGAQSDSPDEHMGAGDHQINSLPADSRTLMVADSSRLIYIRRPFAYHSAFDVSPLGDMIREHAGDPAAITSALKAKGFTHVWVHWQELDRLSSTYGFDSDVTDEQLKHLIDGGLWQRKWAYQNNLIELFRLP